MSKQSSETALRIAPDELGIPIYIDTNALLDLLASLEGGFSMVEKITTKSSSTSGGEASGGAEFGIPNVFSMLRINLGRTATSDRGEQREAERYHTYGSLLNQLRGVLRTKGLLKEPANEESWAALAPSDFVQLRGRFVTDPLTSSLRTLNQSIDAIRFINELGLVEMDVQAGAAAIQNPRPGRGVAQAKKAKPQLSEMDRVQKFLNQMFPINDDESQLLIVNVTGLADHRAVVSIFSEYLRDKSLSEIPQADFVLLGKVARNLRPGESINLVRGSKLAGFSDEVVGPLFDALKELGKSGSFKLPEIQTSVEAPAIQVIPIGILV